MIVHVRHGVFDRPSITSSKCLRIRGPKELVSVPTRGIEETIELKVTVATIIPKADFARVLIVTGGEIADVLFLCVGVPLFRLEPPRQ